MHNWDGRDAAKLNLHAQDTLFDSDHQQSIQDAYTVGRGKSIAPESSIAKYNTKNYLISQYIDKEWIQTIQERNGRQTQQKEQYTKEQAKLIKLGKKIEKKVKKGAPVNEGLLALKTIYTMPQALEEVKQVGFEQMKKDTEELRRSPSPTRFQ